MSAMDKGVLLSSAVFVAIFSQQAFATNGMSSHGFGNNQKAMGGAAVAGSENAMSIASNPASMSFGKSGYTVGLDIFVPDRGTTLVGDQSFSANEDEYFPIPEFAYQKDLGNGQSLGIAVYGNGGMNTAYNAPIFDHATGINSGIDLAQLFISPSWSMKATERTSIGASLNLAYQRVSVKGIADFTQPGFSVDPTKVTDQGYDSSTGVGVSLGMQHQLSDDVKIGMTYRSRTFMSKFDKYAGLFAEGGDLDVPEMVAVGVDIKASPKTRIAMDFSHIRYEDVESIGNDNTLVTGTGQLGADTNGAGFGWENQTIVKVGVKHEVSPTMAIMAGYNHGNSPVKSSQTAFNVLASATVEDHLTLGAEWKLNANSKLSAQYMHALSNEIKGDPTSQAAYVFDSTFTPRVADLEMSQNAFGLAYTTKF